MSEGQYRGLRPWPKGTSGNPKGRTPRKRPLTSRLQLIADIPVPAHLRLRPNGQPLFPPELGENVNMGDAAMFALFMKAMTGDVSACREVRVAIEGREAQRIEMIRETIEEEILDDFETQVAQMDPANRNLVLAAEMKLLEIMQEGNPVEPTPSGLAPEPSGEIGAQEAGPEGTAGPDVPGSEGAGPKA